MPNPRIEPLKRVLAMEPDDDVAWFGLGKAYMDDANFEGRPPGPYGSASPSNPPTQPRIMPWRNRC